jgi:Icc-related predicted phosphoesterase
MINALIFGDTHNIFKLAEAYGDLLDRGVVDRNTTVIHVGDVGIWRPGIYGEADANKLFELFEQLPPGPKMWAIRGNHDNPAVFDGRATDRIALVKDHTVMTLNGRTYAFVGGAVGGLAVEAWGDEEGPIPPPDPDTPTPVEIVIAHDIPHAIWKDYSPILREKQKRAGNTWIGQELDGNKEVEAGRKILDLSLKKYAPRLWVNGHYHEDIKIERPSGTTFLTVNQNTVLHI